MCTKNSFEMDAIDLLAREDEFKRLNKQLEKKTQSLMKEIDHVMQKQDIFSDFSRSLTTPTYQNFKKHCCTPPSQPDTPIKRIIKKKRVPKLESPKSLDSEESEFETRNRRDSEFGSQPLKNRSNSEFESKTLNKTRKDSDFDSNVQNKNGRGSEFESETQNGNNNPQTGVVCDCCPHSKNYRNDDLEFLHAFVNVNVKDKVLPPSFSKEDRVTVESVCKFLSSKIKLMQEQIDKLQNCIDKKASQCQSHLTQLAELESERMTLLNRTNNMKSSTADMRAKFMATQKRLEEKDKLYKEQRSETDKMASELKRLKSKNSSVEAKCASLEQLVDSLRHQTDLNKRSEKELRDSTRQLSATYESAISRLEAQLAALTARSDKQAALAHVLRKQNALLLADGAVHALGVEYAGFLNQDF